MKQVNDALLKQLALRLDQLSEEASLDEAEREDLSDLIVELALDLLDQEDDAELEQVCARHSGLDENEDDDDDDLDVFELYDDFSEDDAEYAGQHAEFAELMQRVHDLDIGDLDLRSEENREVVRALIVAEETGEPARQRSLLAASARAERARILLEEKVAEAMGALYRELADAFNASPAPGEASSAAKVEFIQRAEAAHAAGDLPALLAFRIELEQRGMVSHLPEKELAHYNKLLKEQLRLTELEIAEFVNEAAMYQPEVPVKRLTPESMLDMLKADIVGIRQQIDGIERDLVELKVPGRLKSWLQEPN